MTSDELQALVRAIVEKIDRERPIPKLIPARVVSFGAAEGFTGTAAIVRLVGDPAERTMQVPSLVSGSLLPNDMVMVMFDPPQGAYVFARVPGGGNSDCPSSIRLVISGDGGGGGGGGGG